MIPNLIFCQEKRGMKNIKSFCVGLKDSQDIIYAEKVAKFLGTDHVSLIFDFEEGIDVLSDVIYNSETYNQSNVRAGTAMYLLARKIKSYGIKYCLCGEGADEIFGGYLYFHRAPDPIQFQQELIRKVQDINQYVLKRCNKVCMSWGLELRPPFLNVDFLNYSMMIDPKYKMVTNSEKKIEKYILRKAFDQPNDPYLPDEVLWRTKEQFSNGVGYSWKQQLENYSETQISDEQFNKKQMTYPFNTPFNKEAYLYRQIFEQHFPSQKSAETVKLHLGNYCCSQEASKWDEKSFKFQ